MDRYERGVQRYCSGEGWGGRYVPPDHIRANTSTSSRYSSKNREVFESLKDQFDNWAVFDSSQNPSVQVSAKGTVS